MSNAQPSVSHVPLHDVSPPPTVPISLHAMTADAALDARWAAWQARGHAQDAVRGERVRMAAVAAVTTAALAGVMRLSFGWFQ